MNVIEANLEKMGVTFDDVALDISNRFSNENTVLKSISANHIQAITSDLTVEIFRAYLKHFKVDVSAQVDPELLVPTDASQEVLLSYMDILIPLKYMFCRASVLDFSISDILFPTPKRSLFLFLFLENFAKYFDSKHELICEEVCNIAQMTDQHRMLVKQSEDLHKEVIKQTCNRAQRINNREALVEKIQKEKKALKTLAENNKNVSSAHDSLNSEVFAIKSLLEKRKEVNLSLKLGIANRKKQVAPPVAQINSELKMHKDDLDSINEEINIQKHNYETFTKASQLRKELIEWQPKLDAMLQKVKEMKSKLLNEKRAGAQNCMSTDVSNELKALNDDISLDKQAVKSLEEEMTGVQLMKQRKVASLKKSIANEEKEKEKLELQFAEMKCSLDQLQTCYDKVVEEVNALLENERMSNELFKATEDELIREMERRQDEIGKRWKVINTIMTRKLQEMDDKMKKL